MPAANSANRLAVTRASRRNPAEELGAATLLEVAQGALLAAGLRVEHGLQDIVAGDPVQRLLIVNSIPIAAST